VQLLPPGNDENALGDSTPIRFGMDTASLLGGPRVGGPGHLEWDTAEGQAAQTLAPL